MEYDDAGFSLREYWNAMKEEIESAANSLSLYSTQRRLLELNSTDRQIGNPLLANIHPLLSLSR